MRRVLLPLAFLLVVGYAHAQILVVHFKDQKIARRYRKMTVETADGFVVIGEPVKGGGVVIHNLGVTFAGRGRDRSDKKDMRSNTFFLFNAKDPSDVPYKLVNGKKKPLRKKSKVVINGLDIERLSFLSRSEDLNSLATEYRYRLDRLEGLEANRKEHKKGEPTWFTAHNRLMVEYGRLHSWMREVGYFSAAVKLAKTIKKESKSGKGSAVAARRSLAEDSVKQVAPPQELQAAAKKLDPALTFSSFESTHFIFHFPTGRWEMETMMETVKFAETVLDGFRVEFIDPYVGEDFEDQVAHGVRLTEFLFVPEEQYVALWTDYCGQTWRDERSKSTSGTVYLRDLAPRVVRLITTRDGRDLASTVTSFLGKTLASLHFGEGYLGLSQRWIQQGLAYYLSFEYCGRNTWTTVDWTETGYVKGGRKEGEKTVRLGLRAMFNDLALTDGSRFDKLTLMTVAEMTNADFAKSWSFFDFVAKELGQDGQRWLRSACIHGKSKKSFHSKWRPESELIFDMVGKDVLRAIEKRWIEYAKSQQNISEEGRKK